MSEDIEPGEGAAFKTAEAMRRLSAERPHDQILVTAHEVITPQGRGGAPLSAEIVPCVAPDEIESVGQLKAGDRVLDLPPDVLRQILDSTNAAARMSSEGNIIYCDEFAVMLCGGSTRGRTAFDIQPPEFEFEPGAPTSIADAPAIADLPAMQPIEMGVLKADGSLDSIHTVVKLPGSSGLCISKLAGAGRPVVITDFQGLAGYYEATHCAMITKMEADGGRFGKILEYQK